MLVLVVTAVSQLALAAAAAHPRSTLRVPTFGATRHTPDPEGQRNAQLGCALCLAVADRINASLAEAQPPKMDSKRRLTAAEVSAVLGETCDSGFQGYELWPPPLKEDTDNRLAAVREKVQHCSRPTPPSNWMERLRKECWWYVQEAGEQELYHQWRGMLFFPPQRLDLFLCKNSGWLRVCANLSEEDLPALHPPVVEEPAVAKDATKMATYSITRFRIICTRFLCWRF